MIALDTQTTMAIGAASASLTQILKDLGIQGEWNKLTCIGFSVILATIYMFDQPIWAALVLPLIGTTATGGFSMLQDLAETIGTFTSRS